MDLQNEKCVMVIDENLPLGIIANTAAIMGITLGKQMPEVVGADVYDRTGNGHLGIMLFFRLKEHSICRLFFSKRSSV